MHFLRSYFTLGWGHFWNQLFKALKNPVFVVLTIFGNLSLFICATMLYVLEAGVNPKLDHFTDALWWAFCTMTTIGYGDIVPITGLGRMISLILVFSGGVLFFSFIAIFGSSFTELEFLELRREIRELRRELSKLNKEQ